MYRELGVQHVAHHNLLPKEPMNINLVTSDDRTKHAKTSLSYYTICSSEKAFFSTTASGLYEVNDPSNLFYMPLFEIMRI